MMKMSKLLKDLNKKPYVYITKDGRKLRLIKVWGNTLEFIDNDWNTHFIPAKEVIRYIK